MAPTRLLAVWLFASAALGPPLALDGYSIRPPSGFRLEPPERYRGSHAFVGSSGTLSAALVENEAPAPSSMWIATVDGPLREPPIARDGFAASVQRQLSEIGSELQVRSCAATVDRVELIGELEEHGERRMLNVFAFRGELRHVVVGFSVPASRWRELQPAIAASAATFSGSYEAADGGRRAAIAAALLGLAGLLASVALRRRRARGSRK